MENQNKLMESALEYAINGMPVFPVHTPTGNDGCSCNNPKCKNQGKHPRTKNGLKDATTDKAQIKKWWKEYPDANIGLVTGSVSGLAVLDVDDGGEEELENHPSLPDTVESITGSGGRHIFFVNPDGENLKSKVRFYEGLDIRAGGGYIVVPPSLHASGKWYKWKNGDFATRNKLAECPEWIIDAIDVNKKKGFITSIDNSDRILDGTRNDTLFRYACKLRYRGLSDEEISTLVTSRNKDKCDNPLDDVEIRCLIKSALTYGTDDITSPKLDDELSKMILPFNKFKELNLPEREMLLSPWIQESDLILISGDTGVGKTWFSMEICSAVQNGRAAMDGLWNVETPAKCLYCDGEQHWDDIKKMGNLIGLGSTHILSKTHLECLDASLSLNLTTSTVREFLYDYIINNLFKFVVLDNIYSLWAGIDLDNAKEWHDSNQWLLKLRSKGVCVALSHHTNRSGTQMGTASKLFNLNTSLLLKKTHPKKRNYDGEEIVSFCIKVEKQRAKSTGLPDCVFTCDDGVWSYTEKRNNTDLNDDSNVFYIVLLLLDDRIKKQAEIAKLVGCQPSYVSQIKKYPKYKNMFNEDGKPTSEGHYFLKNNKDLLLSFYDQKELTDKQSFIIKD
jgi:hypothetical protein